MKVTCCRLFISGFICFLFLAALFFKGYANTVRLSDSISNIIDDKVRHLMNEGDIPGLSLIIINGDKQIIKTYGYADIESGKRVRPDTFFELASCSKAFTALAIAKLNAEERLNLESYVSDYIPWFKVFYKDKPVKITINQLLHHTSGIPWSTISKIPKSVSSNALEQTIRTLVNQKLDNLPGKKYQYATINYDVLALIIEKVSHQTFEEYMQENVFGKLNLNHTSIGKPAQKGLMATGYKIGFFSPMKYDAPVFKGNNAAGYIISNAKDLAKWLKFQMGLSQSQLSGLALSTHQRDETVPLHGMSSYAMGWEVSLDGSGEIYHDGLNPNFTSYIAFSPLKGKGVVVLANSNSSFTNIIGQNVMDVLNNDKTKKTFQPDDKNDKIFSIVSLVLCFYIFIVVAFLVLLLLDVLKKRRKYERFTAKKFFSFIRALVVVLPFLYGLYLLPHALAGFNWESVIVWTPWSFVAMIILVLGALAISYLALFVSLFFPETDKYRKILPQMVLLSTLSGLANMALIVLITSSLESGIDKKYLIFYYGLTLTVYILGRRYVQINMIKFSRGLVYEIRMKLIDKIFSTSYQKFEKIDRGRIYAALNDDVNTIGDFIMVFVMVVTSIFTAVGVFVYLASIAFWATVLTISLVLLISLVYYLVSKRSNMFFEEARSTRNVFMTLLNGMIDGYKEISLHRSKKLQYKADIAATADEFKEKISIANIRFTNAFLIGELSLIVLLGGVVFILPKLFPGIENYTIMSFIIILLYLMKPITDILGAVPALMQLKIAWKRIQEFLKEIPANLVLEAAPEVLEQRIESIKMEGVTFRYNHKNERQFFSVGPIDLEVKHGEIVFIIGGNGSGKTTLAKLITGLYEPDEGNLQINNKIVEYAKLSEYFSTVFAPPHLFQRLYNINTKAKSQEIDKYLKILDLKDKVEIIDGKYSTINLSGGQKKRLALLQCYLEDSPIYLFDEWAADQDPEYRNFFYKELLPAMKKSGKIVIAITHDDQYFDVADKILKMKQGRLEDHAKEDALPLKPVL